MKKLILVVIGCAAVLAYGSGAFAFHSGATLICSACHTMHYSVEGSDPGDPGGAFEQLLLTADSTDLCLTCHDGTGNFGAAVGGESPQNVVDPTNDFPGGSFNQATASAATRHDPGGTLLGTDVSPVAAPGGGFDPANLRCSSCHDPHGNANFRILKDDPDGDLTPVSPMPAAFETDIGGSTGSWSGESLTAHNGYVSGMSDWCASCHGDFHGVGSPPGTGQGSGPFYRHPTSATATATQGQFATGMATNYGGTYDPVVPFEDSGVLAADANTSPTDSQSKVFCLSCHRAHGSTYVDAGRWDFSVASGSGTSCNKCHGK
jgi:hypothetical protein